MYSVKNWHQSKLELYCFLLLSYISISNSIATSISVDIDMVL